MSVYSSKPDSVLRKAKDLYSLGKPRTALKALDGLLWNKQYRQWQPTHEKIMCFYVDLAVQYRINIKLILVQYRTICSTVQLASLEKVLKYYQKLCEDKVESVQASHQITLVQIDDLDENTPDDIINTAYSMNGMYS